MLDRRLVRLALPLAVGALALTACGGSSGGSSSGDSGKKSYTLAYQGPLSGDNAQLGINMDNGVRLAVEQANKKGDLGFTLKFTNSDDVGDPAQGPTAAQKLIDDESGRLRTVLSEAVWAAFRRTVELGDQLEASVGRETVEGSGERIVSR